MTQWAGTLVDPMDPQVPVHPPVALIRDSALEVLLALEAHRSLLTPGLALIGQDGAPGRRVHLPEGLHPSEWDLGVVAGILLPTEDRLAEVQGWVLDHVVRIGAVARLKLTPETARAAIVQVPQDHAELMRWGEFVQMLLDPTFSAGPTGFPFHLIWQGMGEFTAAMRQWRLFGVLPADNLLVAVEWWERAEHAVNTTSNYGILNELRTALKALQRAHPQGRGA